MTKKTEAPEEKEEVETFQRDTKLNIHQRINAVMAELSYIKKDKDIVAKGKKLYSVTGHDAVTKLIHPLLVKHGINLIPSEESMEQEGNRTRLEMVFAWVNIDKPENTIQQKWYGYGIDYSDKGPGSAASYAQRYVILKTLHIETGEKDLEDENTDFKGSPIPHSKEVQQTNADRVYDQSLKDYKDKKKQQDLPLPDGTQISDGTTLDVDLRMQVKKMFISKKMGTDAQKDVLDQFQIDSIDEILNSDYEKVIKLIKDAN